MEEEKNLVVVEPDENPEEKFVYCYKCGTKHLSADLFCSKCGESLKQIEDKNDVIRCPKCGSKNSEFVTYQASSDFDKGEACCGYLLCGPLGLLCGAKEKEKAKTVRKCKNCCHEF